MKEWIKLVLEKCGLGGIILIVRRVARKLQALAYTAVVTFRFGFAIQRLLLPPQFLERPVFIDPSTIKRCLVSPSLPAYQPVSDGDWDLKSIPLLPHLRNLNHYQLMYEMFVEHKPFSETSQYKEMEQEIRTRGETVNHNFTSIEQVLEHLETYEPIFNDIKANGYKTQEQLGNPPFVHEMKVNISRDGEILFVTQGTHRLAMAQILSLNRIPVGVWTVHREWAQSCFKQYGGGVINAVYKGLENFDPHHCSGKAQSEQILPLTRKSGNG